MISIDFQNPDPHDILKICAGNSLKSLLSTPAFYVWGFNTMVDKKNLLIQCHKIKMLLFKPCIIE
jgi:hypothetical protein